MAFLLRGTWQPGVDGMGCFRIYPVLVLLPISPPASRFPCFRAPINPLLSGETPKLKKNIYMCVDMYEGGGGGCSARETEGWSRGAEDPGRQHRAIPFSDFESWNLLYPIELR